MAESKTKIKVHEIAKDLGRPSKDIVQFLQEKGYDVKVAQSSVEEETARMVRKAYGKEQVKEPRPEVVKADKPQEIAQPQQDSPNAQQNSPKVRENAYKEPRGEGKEEAIHPKKKKSIIFVSNPQNSKMPGGHPAGNQGQRQGQQQKQQNRQGNQYNSSGNRAQGAAPVRPIKPLTPPSPTPSVQMVTSKTQQSKPGSHQESPEKRGEGSAATAAAPQNVPVRTGDDSAARDSHNQISRPQDSNNQVSRPQDSHDQVSRPQDSHDQVSRPQDRHDQGSRPQDNRNQGSRTQDNRNQGNRSQDSRNQGSRPQNSYQGSRSQDSRNQGSRPQDNRNQGGRSQDGYQGNRPQGGGYQGNRPQGEGYQGNRPQGGGYQGNRPQGEGYQGNRSQGSGYQGNRPQGEGYQGNRPQGGGYQGNRPQGEGYQGNRPQGGGYQGNRPQGGGYQGNRPQGGGYQGNRPQGEGYQGNRSQDGRSSGGQYQNRGGANNGRPSYNRPEGGQGDRRGSGSGAGPNRPYNNTNRDNRGTGGPGDKFRGQQPGKSFASEGPAKGTDKKREEDKRRISQEKDKRFRKDHVFEEDAKLKNKPGRFIKPEKKQSEELEEAIKVIVLPEIITIKELAEKMKLQPSAIVKKLFLSGKIVTVNQEISYEDAENITMEYDILCEKEVKVDVIEELLKEEEEAEEHLAERPPVVCVMGHVDHGKTSLLDAIRETNVIDKEAGGITQHIGAYTVSQGDRKITFLDTPGHEAFTAMRMRGANSTDIAILVVAADDGVMPQTVEAINHAKAAGIEIIVAVNKIDKPSANIDRVKQELTEYELISEDWGGSTVFAPVSAKTGEGIEQLLEMILLTADIMELKANPDRMARGLVIEAELDKGRGAVATVLVQKGSLHVGDFISAGASHGKVRAMIDDKGRRVKEAGPSTPVEILGLSDVPGAGEVFLSHENDKTAKSYAETYLTQNKEKMLEETKSRMSLDDLFSQIQEGNLKELNLIVKADVQGSVEAVKQSLLKLTNEEVVVKCIHGGVGAINESDVMLAMASSAIIIGFNVRPDVAAKATAEREGVDVRLYKVIYQAIEDIEAAMKGMRDPVFEEKVIGHAEVRQIFKASAIGNIAGSYVLDGYFQRGCKVRISREGNQIYEGVLASLKRFKDDVKEVKTGFECGLVFDSFDQLQELDIVEGYIMVEVPR